MYTVYYETDPLFVPGSSEYYLLSPKLSLESNSAGKLTFTIRKDHPYYGDLAVLENKVIVKDDDETVFFGRIIDMEQDFYNDVEVTAEGYLAVLNDSVQRPYEFTGTPEELLKYLIGKHNEEVGDGQKLAVGTVTVTDPNDYILRSWSSADTTWNVINKHLLDSLGGNLVLRYEEDGEVLDWMSEITAYSTQHVEFGSNLMDLSVLIDASATCTACVPYGAEVKIIEYKKAEEGSEWAENRYFTYDSTTGEYSLITEESAFNSALASSAAYEIQSETDTGKKLTIEEVNDEKDYLIDEELAAVYGTIYAKTENVTWDDVTKPDNLLTKAKAYLAEEGVALKRTVDLSCLDLSRLGVDAGKMRMGQNIYVTSSPHGISASYLVTKMDIPLDAPEDMVIKLGGAAEGFVSRQQGNKQSQEKESDAVREDLKDKEEQQKEYTDSKIETASSQILQTSEKIVMSILAGYTTQSDLETYKKEIENTLSATSDGFEFRFKQFEEDISGMEETLKDREEYVRISDGVIYIGKSGSAVTTRYTNDSLQFLYNGVVIAEFKSDALEVKAAAVETQIRVGSQWAIRKGAYQQGIGYNLNDMWIGG